MAHKPAHHLRRFVGAVVVHDDVDVTGRRQLRVEALEEFQKLLMAMPAMTLADHFPGRDIQGRKQRGRAVANVVVGLAGRDARAHRQQRPRAVQRLHLTFSSIDNTMARSGGHRYSPTMSRTFSTNCGSADSLNVSTRCDCSPNVCQMREIVAFDSPATSARLRVVHCVAWAGGPSSVRVITSTIRSSVALRGAPGRGSSVKPARRRTRNRSRHLQTLLLDTRQPLGHRPIRETLRTGEDHPRPQRQPLRRLRAARPLLQRAAFVLSQQQRLVMAFSRHAAQRTCATTEVQDFF